MDVRTLPMPLVGLYIRLRAGDTRVFGQLAGLLSKRVRGRLRGLPEAVRSDIYMNEHAS